MAGAGFLEKSARKAFFDDTTPLTFSIVTNRLVPKQNYVVRKPPPPPSSLPSPFPISSPSPSLSIIIMYLITILFRISSIDLIVIVEVLDMNIMPLSRVQAYFQVIA